MQNNGTSASTVSDRPLEFRLFLQEELLRRCRKNPRFSLRAFARTLAVEASALSKILNGKRSLTPKMLHRFAAQLGLGPDEVARYELALATSAAAQVEPGQTQLGQEPAAPLASAVDGASVLPVAADAFAVHANWYHEGILELLRTKTFKPQAAWIARSLGLTVSEANFALQRLMRLGLIEVGDDGSWKRAAAMPVRPDSTAFAVSAERNRESQALQKALDATESVPNGERDIRTLTLALNSADCAALHEKISLFYEDLQRSFNADPLAGGRDQVYQVTVAFLPVSRPQDAVPGPAAPLSRELPAADAADPHLALPGTLRPSTVWQ